MNANVTRRDFIKATGAAALAAAALPAFGQDTKKMTIAFVGVAHIHTPQYVNIVKKRSDVTVKYVWDHDADRAAQRAKELDAQTVADAQTIWADPEITAVVNSFRNRPASRQSSRRQRRAEHMFAEKPLCASGKEAREMAAVIEKSGVLFTTGYFNRTDPKKLFLKSEIAAGNFGTITRVRGSNCHNGSLGGWFDKDWRWMADPKQSGVGAFGDLGTHLLDILMWQNGDIEAVTAKLAGDAPLWRWAKPVKCRSFQERCDWHARRQLVDIENPVELLISGTQGHAVIVNGQLYYRSEKRPDSDAKKVWKDLPPATKPPMTQFLDAVAGSKDEPLVTPAEAAARVAVMEAMYEGARKRKWVEIG